MKPGYIKNRITNQTEEIDECHLMPTMCNHGRCMNTPGSFECQCDRGFIYDINVHQCIGMRHLFIICHCICFLLRSCLCLRVIQIKTIVLL
jgi:hypothetical protein